mgnify:CR=1 FL=1
MKKISVTYPLQFFTVFLLLKANLIHRFLLLKNSAYFLAISNSPKNLTPRILFNRKWDNWGRLQRKRSVCHSRFEWGKGIFLLMGQIRAICKQRRYMWGWFQPRSSNQPWRQGQKWPCLWSLFRISVNPKLPEGREWKYPKTWKQFWIDAWRTEPRGRVTIYLWGFNRGIPHKILTI